MDIPVGIEFFLCQLIGDCVPVGNGGKHQEYAVFFAGINEIVKDFHIAVFHNIPHRIGDLPFVHMHTDKVDPHQFEVSDIPVNSLSYERLFVKFYL